MQSITSTMVTFANANLNDLIPINCSACINLAQISTNIVLDRDMEWNKEKAPYLFDVIHGFSLGNGQPIPLTEGDYLVSVTVETLPNCGLSKNECETLQNSIFLPGSLIRNLKQGDLLELQYKGKLLKITIQNVGDFRFENLISSIENYLYPNLLNSSSKAVRENSNGPQIEYQYPHPKKERPALFRFDQESKSFVELKKLEPGELNGFTETNWCINPANRQICIEFIGQIKKLFLIFDSERLCAYFVKEEPQRFEHIRTSIRTRTFASIDLKKECKISQQDLIKKLPSMKLENGYLTLFY